jgi:hypothetical protein
MRRTRPGSDQASTDQGRNCADEGRLSRAVGTEQGGDLPRFGNEIETGQRFDFTETLAKPTSLDDCRHPADSVVVKYRHFSPFEPLLRKSANKRIGLSPCTTNQSKRM